MSDDPIERAAIALREAARKFRDPVALYVEPEALYRWDKANDYDIPPCKDWDLESWKILARVVFDSLHPTPSPVSPPPSR